MKRIFIFLIIWVIATHTEASKIKALFAKASFSVPSSQPYIETYLSVNGRSVKYVKNNSGKFQGSIEVTFVFKQAEKIVKVDKYNLLTPEVTDTTNVVFNFIDQKRYSLPNGEYMMELTIADNNETTNSSSLHEKIILDYPSDKISMSDISLIESYQKSSKESPNSKSGYDLVPMVDNFFATGMNSVIFYNEIYNTTKASDGEQFLLSYYIENAQNGEKLTKYAQFKKVPAREVIVTLSEFNIEELLSGNYNLVVELKNKENQVVAIKKIFLQRSNKSPSTSKLEDMNAINVDNSFAAPYTKEEMVEHIRSLAPIATQQEQNFVKTLLKNDDEVQMKKYLVYFWQKREPNDAEAKWREYELNVKKVNKSYSSKFTKGYDTDRGVIYLRYGPPNAIRKNEFDAKTYPYEIWHYYKVRTQSNRRFVFYSPDNVANELVLLHSDVNGEKNDPQWKYKIMARTMMNNPQDGDPKDDYYGGKLEDDYRGL
jgi:GWxTD domain-containing protein